MISVNRMLYNDEVAEIAEIWGLGNFRDRREMEIWMGHSLHPSIANRYYSIRCSDDWRNAGVNKVVAALGEELGRDGGMARLHRMMRDAVEYTAEFSDESPEDFIEGMQDYLID